MAAFFICASREAISSRRSRSVILTPSALRLGEASLEISTDAAPKLKAGGFKMTERERKELIASLETQMKKAAKMLEYEIAAQLRDEIIRLRGEA